jgi:hypothetical protein
VTIDRQQPEVPPLHLPAVIDSGGASVYMLIPVASPVSVLIMESEEKLNAWVHKLAQPPMGLLGLFPAAPVMPSAKNVATTLHPKTTSSLP